MYIFLFYWRSSSLRSRRRTWGWWSGPDHHGTVHTGDLKLLHSCTWLRLILHREKHLLYVFRIWSGIFFTAGWAAWSELSLCVMTSTFPAPVTLGKLIPPWLPNVCVCVSVTILAGGGFSAVCVAVDRSPLRHLWLRAGGRDAWKIWNLNKPLKMKGLNTNRS